MSTKQIIRIELSTRNYKTVRLSALIAWLASLEGLDITRLEVKEVKK